MIVGTTVSYYGRRRRDGSRRCRYDPVTHEVILRLGELVTVCGRKPASTLQSASMPPVDCPDCLRRKAQLAALKATIALAQ